MGRAGWGGAGAGTFLLFLIFKKQPSFVSMINLKFPLAVMLILNASETTFSHTPAGAPAIPLDGRANIET